MTRLKVAKLLLSISVSLTALGGPVKSSVFPRLDCGTYTITGVLKHGATGHYLVSVNDGSTAHYEIFVIGGSFGEKFDRARTRVTVEVYVPKPVEDQGEPYTFLQRFLATDARDKVTLVKRESCGDEDRFRDKP